MTLIEARDSKYRTFFSRKFSGREPRFSLLAQREISSPLPEFKIEPMTLEQVRKQQVFAERLANVFTNVMQGNYQGIEAGIPIGSFYQGTNVDSYTDIDITFPNIPHDPRKGYVDWTTYPLEPYEKMADLARVRDLDPRLHNVITQSLSQLDMIGSSSQFDYIQFPLDRQEGLILNLTTESETYGHVHFDISLDYGSHFGIEHIREFMHYITSVRDNEGDERAAQLINDIRKLKLLTKQEYETNGVTDYKKRVKGFLIELLFMRESSPKTFDQVINELYMHAGGYEFFLKDVPLNPNYLEQLIGSNKSIDAVLRNLSAGGYQTLKKIAGEQRGQERE